MIYICFFKQKGFLNVHLIHCLKPLYDTSYTKEYSLNNRDYLDFLNKIFILWFQDVLNGFYMSIRHIDIYMMLLMQGSCEACSMRGVCFIQYVIEGNGNVYFCDSFSMDDYCLENIKDNSFY